MATATLPKSGPATQIFETVADLLAHLGGIPPNRIRLSPTPGTAIEPDLIELNARGRGIYELVDGVLVEKPMGKLESMLAGKVLLILRGYVDPRDLGLFTVPDGMMRLAPAIIRAPDVSFIAWDQIPPGPLTEASLAAVVPDLAVEVLSPSNTKAEMARKRQEYFTAGVRLVWEVDPPSRTVAVYTDPERPTVLDSTMTLDGGDVLPGFRAAVSDLFADLDRQRP